MSEIKIEDVINAVLRFGDDSSLPEFKKVFGNLMGEHLYGKYVHNYNTNIVYLWASLDLNNRRLMCSAINNYIATKKFNEHFW
jgi:hypothetical protein